jgi:ectoine hydroxylase-related dioxygenase (phytanoyl-CoA dioxygenase family)
MKRAARNAGIAKPKSVFIEVPAGSCVFHAGENWHGSAANTSGNRMRRSIGIHMTPAGAMFSDRPGGYIYRRYQRTDDPMLDESYFPILWRAMVTVRPG